MDVLKVLLDYTRDVDVQDREGQSPAHLAAFHGETECIEILAERGLS